MEIGQHKQQMYHWIEHLRRYSIKAKENIDLKLKHSSICRYLHKTHHAHILKMSLYVVSQVYIRHHNIPRLTPVMSRIDCIKFQTSNLPRSKYIYITSG